MKKIFLRSLTGLFLAWTIAGIVYGQGTNDIVRSETPAPKKAFVPQSDRSNLNSGLLRRGEINTNAARSFIRKYPDVTDASWSKSANGLYVAYFKNNTIQYWIFYNQRGQCEYTLCYYTEENLAPEIRHLIKSKYYDFNIYQVSEVSRNDKIAYVIKLEDKLCWKTVKVVDSEMEVIEEYSKKLD